MLPEQDPRCTSPNEEFGLLANNALLTLGEEFAGDEIASAKRREKHGMAVNTSLQYKTGLLSELITDYIASLAPPKSNCELQCKIGRLTASIF